MRESNFHSKSSTNPFRKSLLTTSDLSSLWTEVIFFDRKTGKLRRGCRCDSHSRPAYRHGRRTFAGNSRLGIVFAFAFAFATCKKNHSTWLTHRLKDKIGVRTMASGEITFQNTEAFLIGCENEGFKIMTEMVNLSLLYTPSPVLGLRACLADLTAEFYGHLFLVFEATKKSDHSDGGDVFGANAYIEEHIMPRLLR